MTVVELYFLGNSVIELNGEYVSEITIFKNGIKEFTFTGLGAESMTPKKLAAMQKETLR
ncbi:hypothetical protein [Peribacillus simplex]|uniref:hypothetical protein n=1 Tax=Peribacillus simplex TaxID=1478 RepID=UPI003D9BCA0B